MSCRKSGVGGKKSKMQRYPKRIKKVISAAVIISVIIALSFAKDAVIRSFIEKGVEFATGAALEMESFRVGIIKTLVWAKGLKIHNPEGYPDSIMADIPEVYVDYDLSSLPRGVVHLSEMRINLNEFTVMKNKNGEVNVRSLKIIKPDKPGRKGGKAKKEGGILKIEVDSLELKIGKVIYKDYSKGSPPAVQEFNINIDERYSGVENLYMLVSLIVVRSLKDTTISRLADIDLSVIEKAVSGPLSTAREATKKVFKEAKKTLIQGVQESQKAVEEVTGKTTEGLKKATEDLIKLPFGENK